MSEYIFSVIFFYMVSHFAFNRNRPSPMQFICIPEPSQFSCIIFQKTIISVGLKKNIFIKKLFHNL